MPISSKDKPKRKLGKAPALEEGDFYLDGMYMVFTGKYLQKRGTCCGSGCRHCPYGGDKKQG
jgi:Family of unknown function (DUF5522)